MTESPIHIAYASSRTAIGSPGRSDASITVTLLMDKWDDFGSKTLFRAYIAREKKLTELGQVRLMVEEEDTTSSILERDIPEGERLLDLGGKRYLSLGSYEYYKTLVEIVPEPDYRAQLLTELHDVIYLEHRAENDPNLDLRNNSTFSTSLLRDSDFVRAYGHARKELLFRLEENPHKFDFALSFHLDGFTAQHSLPFSFAPNSVIPTNVHILIGKNGTGKTQALYHLINALLDRKGRSWELAKLVQNSPPRPFRPQFRQLVAVSFSPFEEFPTQHDLSEAEQGKYVYCGFRSSEGIIDLNAARHKSVEAILSILLHDRQNLHAAKREERPKYQMLLRVLRELFPESGKVRIFLKCSKGLTLPGNLSECLTENEGDSYLDIEEALSAFYQQEGAVREALQEGQIENKLTLGLTPGQFLSRFSAGQEMFLFVVFATVANIRRESLILLDEPELYLHPNLEISYLRMLLTLLDTFESYAIIATHSALLAREVPSRNVTILRHGNPVSPIISRPNIETFGADLTQISNEAFDDVLVKKPFETWLNDLIGKGKARDITFKDLIEEYGSILNMESLAYLRNLLLTRQEEERVDA